MFFDTRDKGRAYNERHLAYIKEQREHVSSLYINPPYEMPPLHGEENYSPTLPYGLMPPELVKKIRDLPSETRQMVLGMILKDVVERYDACIRETEAIIQSSTDDDDDTIEGEQKEDGVIELPSEIRIAAETNDVPKVLEWLGPTPIPQERINATNSEKMGRTLLHEAQFENLQGLMSLLLQHGADVDPVSIYGMTPLQQASQYPRLHDAALLLLEWGAKKEKEIIPNGEFLKIADYARMSGNHKLAKLIDSPLGGRRCEIVGLKSNTGLNGMTCITTKYLPKDDKYIVRIEEENCQDMAKVKSTNLIRRDRTPSDRGIHVFYAGEDPSSGGNIFGWRYDNIYVMSEETKEEVKEEW